MDETLVSDGTNVANVPLYSKLVAFKAQLFVRGSVTTPGVIRWMLVKNTDNDRTASDWMTAFHNSSDDSASREARALIYAKGMMLVNESSGVTPIRVFIKNKTLKRLSSFRENDRLDLVLGNSNAPSTNPTLHGFGGSYWRLN